MINAEEKQGNCARRASECRTRLFALCSARVKIFFLAAFLLAALSAGARTAAAQVQLIFDDAAPTLETGTALSANARYRFKNVAPNTDALVTIGAVTNGATLVKLDDNATSPERFQPVIRTTAANTTAYVRFNFQLVAAGTSTARAVPTVYVSAQDIDGNGAANGIREWVEFVGLQAVAVANPTLLASAAAQGGGTRYLQTSPSNVQDGIGTDDRYEMYSSNNASLQSFSILGGNTSGSAACSGAACDRLNSYAFDAGSAGATVPAPDVSITKTGTTAVFINNVVTYTLVARNNGATAANGTTVTDSVPASLTGVAITCAATGGATCPATAGLTRLNNEFIGTLPNGGQLTFTITGTAPNVGVITNTATIAPPNGSTDPNSANNTSATVTTNVTLSLSVAGTVYEDAGYTGGAGRSLAAAAGSGRPSARVELYDAGGNFLAATATNSAGQYQFSGYAPGDYTVRVVSSTVSSARAGYTSALIGVQTFRTNGGAADGNRVGGENPGKADAAANTTNAALSTLTTAAATANSIAPVTLAAANAAGVDFGFNFDTIVNINDAGQGSLRQFILNANALTGADATIFMIADGAAHGGLRSGLVNQLTGGVAVITTTSLLPALTDADTTIDGATQTANVGNTNAGTLGTGGTVGVDNLPLPTVARPEVQITDGTSGFAVGLDLQASNQTVRGIAIFGFGTTANADGSAGIRLGANAANALIEQNIIGAAATGIADPGAGLRSIGDNVRSVGADNGILRRNIIAFSQGKGFGVEAGSTGWLIENNEIRSNAIGNSNLDGIDLESAGTINNTVRGNLIYDNEGVGVDSYQSNGSNVIVNNTISGNGVGAGANIETPGIRLYGANNVADRNKVFANFGAGVLVTAGASANTLTRNSIYANGTISNRAGAGASNEIGIDLQSSADSASVGTAAYVTLNDAGDADAGGNGLLNFPVFETAEILNGNLVLKGFAAPGAIIEVFVAAPDASGFGEGQTYLLTLIEGSAQDGDAAVGTYASPVGGRNVGTDTTNRFNFTAALPAGAAAGTILTATATVGGATSEFSSVIALANAPPNIILVKSVTPEGTQLPGTELTYRITFTNIGGQSANNFALTDPNPAGTLKINTSTDFKVGSVATALGTTGLTAAVTYSNDGGATFSYTPASGAGGAAAGYDATVTHIRWAFGGALTQTSPNNTGNISFTVKIR